MNRPKDENNFLVEITPEVKDELNRMFMHSDEEPIVELHYSPYWIKEESYPIVNSSDEPLSAKNNNPTILGDV